MAADSDLVSSPQNMTGALRRGFPEGNGIIPFPSVFFAGEISRPGRQPLYRILLSQKSHTKGETDIDADGVFLSVSLQKMEEAKER